MKRIIVLSDVHSNRPAMKAVWEDIKTYESIDNIWFLGDLFGYGVYPVPVYQDMESLAPDIWLKGNHDGAIAGIKALFDGMNEVSKHSANWHKNIPTDAYQAVAKKPSHDDTIKIGNIGVCLSHAIPEQGENGFLTRYETMVAPNRDGQTVDLLSTRDMLTPELNLWIVGHSHKQTAWFYNAKKETWMLFDDFGQSLGGSVNISSAPLANVDLERFSIPLSLLQGKSLLILNPGSVGFPRDCSHLSPSLLSAKYMILEHEKDNLTVVFRSVSYSGEELHDLAREIYPSKKDDLDGKETMFEKFEKKVMKLVQEIAE